MGYSSILGRSIFTPTRDTFRSFKYATKYAGKDPMIRICNYANLSYPVLDFFADFASKFRNKSVFREQKILRHGLCA